MRQDSVKHLANLLATKDPLAFQQVQSVTTVAESGYTGPILSGDEIEEMQEYEKRLLGLLDTDLE
jgi:hypothetical protein